MVKLVGKEHKTREYELESIKEDRSEHK